MKWRLVIRALAIFAATFLITGNLLIEIRAAGRVHSRIKDVPTIDVGLVLGTSRHLHGGYENPFFAGRIAAAVELFRAGKVRNFVLSGDNHVAGYDEPGDMRDALLEAGIPESATTLDDAGFRTLDSFARAKDIFDISSVIIVTDDFHAARAVLLARHFGIDAHAYVSAPVPMRWSMKTRVREIGARVKAVLDIYVLRTRAHFLGPRIPLPIH